MVSSMNVTNPLRPSQDPQHGEDQSHVGQQSEHRLWSHASRSPSRDGFLELGTYEFPV